MHNLTDEAAPHRMLSFTPKPVPSWDNRPAVSSPLSSSPVRASSPHSAAEEDARWQPRQVQSSPIRPNSFKFQSRPARPNPVMKKREELQEQRRKGFLQNVRQKAEDRSWQRRDIEGQFLKTSWLANVGRLSHDAPSFSDADIEDAATFSPEMAQSRMDEDMIPEELMDEEQLLTSYEEEVMAQQGSRLPTLAEDDDEYDDIFAELISQEQERQSLQQQQPHQQHHSSQPSNQMEID